jgi:hypothetical protein
MQMKILTCANCKSEFTPYFYLDGVRIPIYNRKYCIACSPYKEYAMHTGNTNNRNTQDGKRQCLICKNWLDIVCFSYTNKQGNLNSYCKKCSTRKTQKSRQRFKQDCVAYKGGQCVRCGYNKCFASMHFHHRDREQKEFAISRSTTTLLDSKIKQELDKCDLVCANCHGEIEYLSYNCYL